MPTPSPLQRLHAGVKKAGTQRAYADQLGISVQYLNDLLHERRQISAQVAKRLGLVKETTYRESK